MMGLLVRLRWWCETWRCEWSTCGSKIRPSIQDAHVPDIYKTPQSTTIGFHNIICFCKSLDVDDMEAYRSFNDCRHPRDR